MTPNFPIGVSLPRKDGKDKVTGRAKYGADFNLTGQLHAAVYHSPHAHAIIKKLDVSKALALPGVRCVVTGEDYHQLLGQFIADQPGLAYKKVRFTESLSRLWLRILSELPVRRSA